MQIMEMKSSTRQNNPLAKKIITQEQSEIIGAQIWAGITGHEYGATTTNRQQTHTHKKGQTWWGLEHFDFLACLQRYLKLAIGRKIVQDCTHTQKHTHTTANTIRQHTGHTTERSVCFVYRLPSCAPLSKRSPFYAVHTYTMNKQWVNTHTRAVTRLSAHGKPKTTNSRQGRCTAIRTQTQIRTQCKHNIHETTTKPLTETAHTNERNTCMKNTTTTEVASNLVPDRALKTQKDGQDSTSSRKL